MVGNLTAPEIGDSNTEFADSEFKKLDSDLRIIDSDFEFIDSRSRKIDSIVSIRDSDQAVSEMPVRTQMLQSARCGLTKGTFGFRVVIVVLANIPFVGFAPSHRSFVRPPTSPNCCHSTLRPLFTFWAATDRT